MSKKDFEKLLDTHTKPTKTEIDWSKQKDEWIEFIDLFYSKVESWLAPYKKQEKLDYKFESSLITEDYIGTYQVRTMIVNFAGQKFTIEPIGTLLIGTKGRIDMEGPRGSVQFILADKDSTGLKVTINMTIDGQPTQKAEDQKTPDWTWKIVLRRPRTISYIELTEENFFAALMEIVNG